MKLKDAIRAFLQTYRNPKTRATYKASLDKMADHITNLRIDDDDVQEALANLNGNDTTITKYITKMHVKDITLWDAISYIDSLMTHITPKGKPLSPHSINKEIKTCRVFFNWLIKIEEIVKSPFSAVRYQAVPTFVDENKAMPDDDLNIILERIKYMPRENFLIRLFADTGIRARGAGELTLDRLDLANCRATVIEKGDKSRIVAYGEDTQKAGFRWLRHRGNLKSPLVFQATDSRNFSAEAAGAMVRRCCILAGVKPRQSHSLRHRKGHQIMREVGDASLGSIALGNSVEVFLRNYASKDRDEALQLLVDLSTKSDKPTPPNVIHIPKHNAG